MAVPKPPFDIDQSLFSAHSLALPLSSSASQSSQTLSPSSSQPPTLSIPAAYHDDKRALKTVGQPGSPAFKRFLEWDLNVSRLNMIHKHLWMAGLPVCARTLHHQIMIGRDILVTERADVHLVWRGNCIYLKPLPGYLMDYNIWKDILCQDRALYEDGNGFLLSYMWLVCHKSDLKIAHEKGLIPSELSWESWVGFSRAVLSKLHHETLQDVSPRYLYGELRLPRLNLIYRFCSKTTNPTILIRGYQYSYHQYSTFVQRNFAWLLTAVVYITVVLTAMQVGLATEQLKNDERFNRASYSFTVFSILSPLIGVVLVAGTVLVLLVFNLLYAIAHRSEKRTRFPQIFRNATLWKHKH
jgi:hypothetical protein